MKIVTDSTADLTEELYRKLDIGMVPLTIQLGERKWRDFYDVSPDAFYELLKTSGDFPTTSQPSPQDFVNAYRPFVEKGEPVLSLHLSSKLSGTFQSASLAASQFPHAKIEVIDSKQASLGLALVLHLCAQKVKQGDSFETVLEYAQKLTMDVETYFSVDSLDYLHRGGRIGKAQAFLGTLMRIKPLMKLIDGAINPVEKIRTTERLINRYVELVEQVATLGKPLSIIIAESDNTDLADGFADRIARIPNVSVLQRCKIGAVITSHTGPGVLGITFVQN